MRLPVCNNYQLHHRAMNNYVYVVSLNYVPFHV